MKPSLFAIFLFSLAVSSLHAQLSSTDPSYQAVCRKILAQPYTPPVLDPSLKPDCDATASYFGIGRPVDYAAARACAFAEYAQPDADKSNNIFFGAGILSVIFANGQGAPVDLDLATRFVCEKWAAPAEIEGRLDALTTARENHTVAHLDLCDTASSGNAEGWCTDVQARLSAFDRNQKMAKFEASLPSVAVSSFADLKEAEDAFLQLHLDEEISAIGSGHRALQLSEDNDLRDQFLSDLETVTTSSFHQDVAEKAADKRLAAALKPVRLGLAKSRLPLAPKAFPETGITFRGIEDTQQAWSHLREAWAAFARAANPTPKADTQAEALITLERAQQIITVTHSETASSK